MAVSRTQLHADQRRRCTEARSRRRGTCGTGTRRAPAGASGPGVDAVAPNRGSCALVGCQGVARVSCCHAAGVVLRSSGRRSLTD
ncbi:hypothetical protein GCM10023113_19020 [Cellulomonas oligotrophica]|uniref:GCM domain-containing protein n=1 Tax=Cellulomonas oligotrophica TaxID=931536 RepID=A0ABQ4DD27_9CELL|nr:hypothetical protein Col01nite_27870 [Cellulomonas oligotrophica]